MYSYLIISTQMNRFLSAAKTVKNYWKRPSNLQRGKKSGQCLSEKDP
jgi:hypothetical protein